MSEESKAPKKYCVALYARVSSDKQAQEGTIESQLALLKERIVADGHVLVADLCFADDGISGSTLARPALERLRDQAAAGMIDQLYVLAPDRLARRYVHQMVVVEELQACGVEVVFLNRPVGTTAEDQLLLQVQGVIGEYERAKILERTRRGRLHAARCGRVSVLGQAPYGYRYLDKQAGAGVAAYEVRDDEAQWARQMFVWVGKDGCSLREVARRLEQLAVPTRSGQSRWNPGTIRGILRNSAYQGQALYGKTRIGEWRPPLRPRKGAAEVPKQTRTRFTQTAPSERIPIPVPALVGTDLFAAVQERLEENRRRLRLTRRGARYLLQGLTVCAGCGYAIYGQACSRGRAYYRCVGRDASRFGGQPVCQNPTQRADDLEAAVWKDVRALLSEPDRLRREFERRQEISTTGTTNAASERLRETIAKIQKGISRLIDAYAEDVLERKEFEPRLRRLRERLAKAEGDLQTLNEQLHQEQQVRLVFSRLEEFAEQMKTGLKTLDWKQRREILRAVVKRVEIGEDKIRIIYKVPPPPFAKAPKGGEQVQGCLWRQLSTGRPRLALRAPGFSWRPDLVR